MARPRHHVEDWSCMVRSRAVVVGQNAGGHAWEMAFRAPPDLVRPHVRQYCGYSERTPSPLRRIEFATPRVVAIFEFGPPLRLVDPGDEARSSRYRGGFVAGLGDSFSITEHDGFQQGMEVVFTPIGGRLFFDLPMGELANQIVSLDQVLGRDDGAISARLGEARDWDERFDLLDELVTRRIANARARTELTGWALDRIEESGGQLDIRGLARDLGYSQKHLIALFRDHVGLPPKLVARLVRFDRVLHHIKTRGPGNWSAIAAQYGYYDQAHLIRDVRQFTGTTPTGAREMLTDLAA
jgi:AraC-like DNA-binding protein